MNQHQIANALQRLPVGEIRYFDSISSTNDYAAHWIQKSPPNFSLVIADEQTAGRGRAGRQWFTPRGAALAISVLLQAGPELRPTPVINGLGALAVWEALSVGWGLTPEIKWPNDVLLGRRKVAGVLPEAYWVGDKLQGMVLGIGINVSRAALPPAGAVSFPAGCVEEACGETVDQLALLRGMVSSCITWYGRLDAPVFLETWGNHLAFKDEMVQVIPPVGEALEGRIAGLTEEGNLRLVTAHGEVVCAAGEVHLRPKPV